MIGVLLAMGMHLSDAGRAALYRRECAGPSFEPSLTAYYDKVGKVWTIWCGITGPDVVEGLTITREQGEAMEAQRSAPITEVINSKVKVPLLQNEWDVLFSFTWNEGVEAFAESTLLKKLNAGQYDQVPSELRRWIKAGGQVSEGLKNRRNSEIAQWNNVPFVAGGAHAADVPQSRIREVISQFHLQLKALGVGSLVSGIGADKLQDAGNQFQGLAQHSHWFAIIGVGLIVLGILYNVIKPRT